MIFFCMQVAAEFLCKQTVFSLTLLDSFHPLVTSCNLSEVVGCILHQSVLPFIVGHQINTIYIVPCSCHSSPQQRTVENEYRLTITRLQDNIVCSSVKGAHHFISTNYRVTPISTIYVRTFPSLYLYIKSLIYLGNVRYKRTDVVISKTNNLRNEAFEGFPLSQIAFRFCELRQQTSFQGLRF